MSGSDQVIDMTDRKAVEAELARLKRYHAQDVSFAFPAPGRCLGRCPGGKWPCLPHRAATALEKALGHHKPEQLYGPVEDWRGKVVCPHGEDYDGDMHYEADDGDWYCKALPTVIVCSSCSDPDDDTLRCAWPCGTWTDIARELGVEVPS